MVPSPPQFFSSTSAASTSLIWICTSWDYRFHWIFIFSDTRRHHDTILDISTYLPPLQMSPIQHGNRKLGFTPTPTLHSLKQLFLTQLFLSCFSSTSCYSLLPRSPYFSPSSPTLLNWVYTRPKLYTQTDAERVSQETKYTNINFLLMMLLRTVGIDEFMN